MINYIKKDILFSKKWLIIAILYTVIVGYIMIKEEGDSLFFVYFFVPFFLVQFPLGKILAMEDHCDTREFLRRMPHKGWIRVTARKLFVAGLLVFGFMCINLYGYKMVDGYQLRNKIMLSALLFLLYLLYFTIEMIVFYRFSYHLAQNCLFFVILVVVILNVLSSRLGMNINIEILNSVFIFVGLLIANVVLFLLEIKAEAYG